MTHWLTRLIARYMPQPDAPAPAVPDTMTISPAALLAARATGRPPVNPWQIPAPAPGVATSPQTSRITTLAMDHGLIGAGVADLYGWAGQGLFSEGLGFLGYPYLAQLSQRPEYRRISEIRAQEATRKWIKLTGADDAKLGELDKALKEFNVQAHFRELIEQDGMFGRGQLFLDTGDTDTPGALERPLVLSPATIPIDGLKALKVVEPIWTYPGTYNSTQPLSQDYYRPQKWFVMGSLVDQSRLLTIVGREMPDILKPAYQFGGLSLSQMVKPYVDNWIRTRQSVSDLVHAFSVMILSTNMSTVLQGGGASAMQMRAQLFTQFRDNLGLWMLDKDTEEFSNVSVPLTSLPELLAQSQEQMASVAGIPLVVLLGVTPSGLNASSDGEIATFHADIHGYQERVIRVPLTTVIQAIQLSKFGAIDEKIGFDFVSLDDMDEAEQATIRKTDADTDAVYISAGVVSNEEVRERLAEQDGGLYHGIDLSGPAPEPESDEPSTPPADA